jgi:hypothetical protein
MMSVCFLVMGSSGRGHVFEYKPPLWQGSDTLPTSLFGPILGLLLKRYREMKFL